jgi:sec-independent protein translocase protein TatB
MFDIGFFEIVLIAVVALLVVGPNEFPTLVRNIGRGLGKVRSFLSSVKSDLDYEIDKANEVKKLMEKEAEIARLHEIIEQNATTVPVQGKPADEPSSVEKVDEHSQAEADQESPQPVSDRRQT